MDQNQSAFALADAQAFLREQGLDGWLIEDFQQSNPILWQIVGGRRHTTRRVFLFVPPTGSPRFLLHFIDVERLRDVGWPIETYLAWADQEVGLKRLLEGRGRIAMEYSADCALPVVARVDAGTIEQIRGLGVEIASSADLIQYAVSRWSAAQLESHLFAANAVVRIAGETFREIGERLDRGIDEYAAREFIRERFAAAGLMTDDPPTVAVNAHAGDPHYEPTASNSSRIHRGDWVLIDLWAKQSQPGAIYGDTTWVGHVGSQVPELESRIFESVRRARDGAIRLLQDSWRAGQPLAGWEVDAVARKLITGDGYGRHFSHRLGHSLGTSVHSNGVNLDGFETHDTRQIIPGLGFSVEPGIYLAEFGVRLEVDVYVDATRGPVVTTPPQTEVVLIGG